MDTNQMLKQFTEALLEGRTIELDSETGTIVANHSWYGQLVFNFSINDLKQEFPELVRKGEL